MLHLMLLWRFFFTTHRNIHDILRYSDQSIHSNYCWVICSVYPQNCIRLQSDYLINKGKEDSPVDNNTISFYLRQAMLTVKIKKGALCCKSRRTGKCDLGRSGCFSTPGSSSKIASLLWSIAIWGFQGVGIGPICHAWLMRPSGFRTMSAYASRAMRHSFNP